MTGADSAAGKVVLVTGGAHGVGRAISLAYAARGAHVIVNYFRSWQEAPSFLDELHAEGGSAELVRASVANRKQVDAMFDTVEQRHGGIDILINNAASGALLQLDELEDRHWQRAWDTDLRGSMWCARRAAPLMAARGGGSIVNLSALGTEMVMHAFAAVGTAKAAVEALTRYLAVEYAPLGIRVNTASASMLDSRVARQFPDAEPVMQQVREVTPLGRLGEEREIADLVLFLASPAASYITGQTVVADGGLSLGAPLMSPWWGQPSDAGPESRATASDPMPTPAATAPASAAGPTPAPQPDDEAIAVVSMGAVTPGANSPDELWDLLCHPEHLFTEPGDRFDIESFWSADRTANDRSYSRVAGYIHGFQPHEVLADELASGRVSPTAHTTVWLRHCLLQAKDATVLRPTDRVACYAGAWPGSGEAVSEIALIERIVASVAARYPADERSARTRRIRELLLDHYPHATDDPDEALPFQSAQAAVAGVLPESTTVTCVDTACSSSLYAVDLAVKSLLNDECDVAFCGGVSVLNPTLQVLFAKLGGLSPTGALRSLDQHADGTLFSDAGGVVALKSLRRALADGDDVLGVLGGFGAAADGRGKSIAAPNPRGQKLAIDRAHAVNASTPADVDWVVAHATATLAGDTSELQTLAEAAPEGGCLVSSEKALVGHGGWAAGVLSLIHVLLAMRHQAIPAQYRFTGLPDTVPADRIVVPRTVTSWPSQPGRRRTAGISSFGFGGTDAHLLVQEHRKDQRESVRSNPAARGDEMVLVGWSSHLPGAPDRDGIERWLAGTGPTPERSFGTPYPEPPFSDVKLPRPTVRAIDCCHVMALEAAHRFVAENTELWADLRETTGVIAAHTGVPSAMTDYALRAYTTDITAALPRTGQDSDELAAIRTFLDEVAERVPAPTEDAMPGVMPNVMASRIASRFDLQGVSLLVDSGCSATESALAVASRYLDSGELDLALVLAVNGNSGPELARLMDLPADQIAEGAFLFALTRESVAREKGWLVRAHLRTSWPADRSQKDSRTRPGERSYLGADGAVQILRALNGSAPAEVGGDTGPVVTVTPADVAATEEDDMSAWTPSDQPAVAETAPEDFVTARYTPVMVDAGTSEVPDLPPLPEGSVVLVSSSALAARLATLADDAGAALVTADPACQVDGVTVIDDVDGDLDGVLAPFDNKARHLRVVTELHSAWPAPPDDVVIRTHELAFLLAQRQSSHWASGGGSFGVLSLGLAAEGPVHPHTALFTGLARNLMLEAPGIATCAVLTDDTSLVTGLARVSLELDASPHPIVWYRNGRRYIERLRKEPAPGRPDRLIVDDSSVIVAAGGSSGVLTEYFAALAAEAKPTLWLLGSTELADIPAEVLDAADDELPAVRAQLIATGRESQPDRHIRELSEQADRMIAARGVAHNVARLRALFGGDRVRYLACDITDSVAVANAASVIYAESKRVDLLIHAVGRFRTAPLHKKTLRDFRTVRDSKLVGYHNLKAAFDDPSPAMWCNIASLACVYPAAGETDYLVANAFLAEAARYETEVRGNQEWTVGPSLWRDAGFAANPVMQSYHDRMRHLTLTSTSEGVTHLRNELSLPRPQHVVGVYTGELERENLRTWYSVYLVEHGGAYLGDPVASGPKHAVWEYQLDEGHTYLHRHLVQGKPTLPGVFMLEMAAEGAKTLTGKPSVLGFRDATFDAFIRPFTGRGPHKYRLTAEVVGDAAEGTTVRVSIESDITAPDGRILTRRQHFATDVAVGGANRPGPPPWIPPQTTAGVPVAGPYYHEDSPVHLTGIFQSTHSWRQHDRSASAVWQPDLGDEPIPHSMSTPGLLTCAALRTIALPPTAPGEQSVVVPRRMGTLELFTDDNDVALARRYPDGIHAYYDADTGTVVAVAPDGTVLLRVDGAETAVMGTVPCDAGVPVGVGR